MLNWLRQHKKLRALSLREKLMRVEQMAAVVGFFLSRRDRDRRRSAPSAVAGTKGRFKQA